MHVFKKLMRIIGRLGSDGSGAAQRARFVEPLENRLLMAAPPHIKLVSADNRGLVILTADAPLQASTVNSKSAMLFRGSTRVAATVTYRADYKQIIIKATPGKVPANAAYKIRLVSSLIKGKNGLALDGEFRGATTRSGNNKPGGDFVAMTAVRTDKKIARFTTACGVMDVELFATTAPKTVANFLYYADRAAWDGTFIHRSVANFVIQGGGVKLNSKDQVAVVPSKNPVQNEPKPNQPGNIRGTIAMARSNDNDPNTHADENSARNEFFFNVSDNGAELDYQNGGFTAFGQIINSAGLAVMDRLAAKQTFDLDGTSGTYFNSTPLMYPAKKLPLRSQLLMIDRIAILMNVKGVTKAPAVRAAAASLPLSAPVASPLTGTFAAGAVPSSSDDVVLGRKSEPVFA